MLSTADIDTDEVATLSTADIGIAADIVLSKLLY